MEYQESLGESRDLLPLTPLAIHGFSVIMTFVYLTFFGVTCVVFSDPRARLLPDTERVRQPGETGWQSAQPRRHPGQSKAQNDQLAATIDHDGQRQS